MHINENVFWLFETHLPTYDSSKQALNLSPIKNLSYASSEYNLIQYF